MTLQEIESKIRKFLSGQKSASGKELFNQWYDSFEEKEINLSHDEKMPIKTRIFNNIQTQINTSQKATPHQRFLSIHFLKAIKVAAFIAFLVVGYLGFQQWHGEQEFVLQTAYGETELLQLPDGTEVTLNANSTLRYFNKNPREVWINGEAFFDVMKQPSKAVFLVHTQDLVIEVLGTAFNVNSRHEKTKVVLEEGSIKLNLQDGQEEMMEPGDLISYSAKHAKILERKSEVQAKVHTSWKDGAILFDQIPLKEAMEKVADQYGVQFVFENDPLKEKKIGGGVPMDNLKISLLTIEKTINVRIEKKEKHYLIIQMDK